MYPLDKKYQSVVHLTYMVNVQILNINSSVLLVLENKTRKNSFSKKQKKKQLENCCFPI